MANDDLAKLRAEALRLHKRVGDQISREKRRSGTNLSGSELDPRRAPASIRAMRTRDVKSHIRRMNAFVQTPTPSFKAADGSVIPRENWVRYKRAENLQRRRANAEMRRVGNLRMPGVKDDTGRRQKGPTIQEREKNIAGTRMNSGAAVNRTLVALTRKPINISSAGKLQALTEAMEQRNTAGFKAEKLANAREEMERMLTVTGNPKHITMMNRLNDEQVNVLWNYTNFADTLSRDYENALEMTFGDKPKERFRVTARGNDDKNISELLRWASRIKP